MLRGGVYPHPLPPVEKSKKNSKIKRNLLIFEFFLQFFQKELISFKGPDWLEIIENFDEKAYNPKSWEFLQINAFNPTNLTNMRSLVDSFGEIMEKNCENFTNDFFLIDRLKSKNFDLVLSHYYAFCQLGIAEILDLPVIWISGGSYIFEHVAMSMQIPIPASVVPSAISVENSNKSNLLDAYTRLYHKYNP